MNAEFYKGKGQTKQPRAADGVLIDVEVADAERIRITLPGGDVVDRLATDADRVKFKAAYREFLTTP